MPNFTSLPIPIKQRKGLSFFDVLRFAAGYWVKQPKKLTIILTMILAAAFFEAYLPSALSSFLGAIREHGEKSWILNRLGIFIGVYLVQDLLMSFAYLVYNS